MLGIYLDIKKAFDSVNHNILLTKLYNIGIRGNMFLLFKDYLSKRNQYVFVDGFHSQNHEIKCGVPQGGNLGHLLFTIYINDICNAIHCHKPKIFADDTNMFIYNTNLNNLYQEGNDAFQQIMTGQQRTN